LVDDAGLPPANVHAYVVGRLHVFTVADGVPLVPAQTPFTGVVIYRSGYINNRHGIHCYNFCIFHNTASVLHTIPQRIDSLRLQGNIWLQRRSTCSSCIGVCTTIECTWQFRIINHPCAGNITSIQGSTAIGSSDSQWHTPCKITNTNIGHWWCFYTNSLSISRATTSQLRISTIACRKCYGISTGCAVGVCWVRSRAGIVDSGSRISKVPSINRVWVTTLTTVFGLQP